MKCCNYFHVSSSTLSKNGLVNNFKSSQTRTQLIIVTDNCNKYSDMNTVFP